MFEVTVMRHGAVIETQSFTRFKAAAAYAAAMRLMGYTIELEEKLAA